MNQLLNFVPYETVPLTAGTSSSSVAFKMPASKEDNLDCMVTNAGAATAFVAFGNGSAAATLPGTTGTPNATPVLAGETMILRKNVNGLGSDTCAAVTASGTTQLYFTAGKGS